MTLSARNTFFKGGIVFSALSLGFVALSGYFAYPAFPGATAPAALRSGGIFQKFITNLAEPSAYVPFWVMLGIVAYSLISIVLIYYFFEKTQPPEILFIGLFVISMTFEFVRIIIPLRGVFVFPGMLIVVSSRLLLFGRYFGLFSLFAAGVYAAGLDAQRQQSLLIMLLISAMLIALNVPIDNQVWDSTFMLWKGYGFMFTVIETGIMVVTIISFLVAAYTRSSRSYILIAIGILLLFIGRDILINSDTWITPIPGLTILAAGTWFVCSRLHLEYLWL